MITKRGRRVGASRHRKIKNDPIRLIIDTVTNLCMEITEMCHSRLHDNTNKVMKTDTDVP